MTRDRVGEDRRRLARCGFVYDGGKGSVPIASLGEDRLRIRCNAEAARVQVPAPAQATAIELQALLLTKTPA